MRLVLRYGSVWISFVLSIQEGCTENVVKFFSSLIALDYYQKHNRKERIKFITQNNVLYKEDLKKLFQTPAITIPDVLQKRNLCQAILLMDLSEAFDCIPLDLVISKLHAYGISIHVTTNIYSYMKRQKQWVTIKATENLFKIILSGVHKGSMLGLILFNIVISDLLFFINEVKLSRFTDDNTIYAAGRNLNALSRQGKWSSY